MDRRKSLKIIAGTAIAGGAALAGCNPSEEKNGISPENASFTIDRNSHELKNEKDLLSKPAFFNAHEMAVITILADIIIPKDEVSGSASDAKVPEFIEFIVKDMPQHQTPLRGGIRWIDMQSLNRFEKSFTDITSVQQIEIVDDIAFPKKVKPGMEQGISFFSTFRDLVATGFYTSEIGVKDLGHSGNNPHQWNGVPEDVLKQYGLAYTEKELKESIKF
jgi:gluconate 2-dehydrogenase gamma chain